MKATLRLCSDDSCMILTEKAIYKFKSFSHMAEWLREHPECKITDDEILTELS